MFAWVFLIIAILLEVSAVGLLQGIPKILESFDVYSISLFTLSISNATLAKINLLFMIALSYYCMSLALREIALGVAYSIWEIVGLIGILFISFVFFTPNLTLQQYIGIAVGFIGVICVILGEEH
ncbi:SMR drug efflux transporter [Helicobacter saguini]|uniref:SMR drug efflux transporter n=1 Tax=Helicobacter saguini TaxID=1548018 RepID=A0A347VU96_9HELI|nr:SMR drug efflux transporter [Helicobacter saguini]MWV66825.1 SMR drug efflux transporter [Helicobacter saguini]MWV69175.1 SMR drug efflux transporter [Helicobacter saguini]MWV71270.1 SMR drug efflux transporter [Helicobacter saguini]TLD94248.1 SMR drug efflux transporter [Helicobacter saguini]